MLACVNRLFIKGGCVIQPPYYYVLLAVKASRRKSRTLRIGLSPLPFLWTAVAGSIIIIVSVRNSYSLFLCYLACVSLSAGLLHSPLPTLVLKSPSTILFHGGYVQIAGNSQQEVIAPNRYSTLTNFIITLNFTYFKAIFLPNAPYFSNISSYLIMGITALHFMYNLHKVPLSLLHCLQYCSLHL